jgi:adenylate cyclase
MLHNRGDDYRDEKASVRMHAKRLHFDRYVLDVEAGSLLLDGKEIVLRPKTFAVLHHLVENSGRLISKDVLFAAIWPNLAVTDDTLVQSIGELRRALGADGAHLIKTVPRRGYRFECSVSCVPRLEQHIENSGSVSAVPRDQAHLDPAPGAPAPRRSFAPARKQGRIAATAALGLATLLLAGVLWSRMGLDWKFENPVGSTDRAAPKISEIGSKPSIAILPFVNQSDESAREYFADGLTQDIINALGRFSELTVMSWNAVLPYKGKRARPEEIAHSLAVRYQFEGTVLQAGDRVRVAAQLVDSNGRLLWSARFDEALADLFALQDKITAQIAAALAIRVARIEQGRVFAKPTENLEAYEYLLRARPALQRPTRGSIAEARTLLRRAIELDPSYAAAYAALAESYYTALSMGWADPPTSFLSQAEELANKALTLDDSEVRARIIVGRIHIFHQQYEQAEADMERAIASNPNDARALAGLGNVMMWLGRTDAAIEALEQAQRIDPDLNAMDRFALSLSYYLKHRYDVAIEQAEVNARETAGANFSRIVLAAAYAEQGRFDATARVVTVIRRTDPTFDPLTFGSKFLKATDLEHLRHGMKKAGLMNVESVAPPLANDR